MKNLPIVLVVEDDKAIVHLLSTILDAMITASCR